MFGPALLLLAAAGLGLGLAAASIRLALRLGAIDEPAHLKPHERATPVLGGIAIVLSTAGIGLPGAWGLGAADVPELRAVSGLVMGAVLLCVLGVVDDVSRVRASVRLLVELTISGLVMVHMSVVEDIVPLWFAPACVLWLTAATNAVNMLDGMDGLAGTLGVVAGVGMGIVAAGTGNQPVASVSCALAGACLGFLYFNRPTAKLFMGDNGSLPLGFLLGGLAVIAAFSAPPESATISIGLGTAIMLGVPLGDMALAIGRRALQGRPLFLGDRGHVYDQIHGRFGLSVVRTLLVIASANVVLTAVGVAVSALWYIAAVLTTTGIAAVVVAVLIVGGFLTAEESTRS